MLPYINIDTKLKRLDNFDRFFKQADIQILSNCASSKQVKGFFWTAVLGVSGLLALN